MGLSKDFIEYMTQANPKVAEALQNGFEANAKLRDENSKTRIRKEASEVFGEFIKASYEGLKKEAHEEPMRLDFLPKDGHIRDQMLKFAGMVVYDTTPEGIEQFLKEYMFNELSFFPDKVDLAVGIMPLDNEPINQGTGQYDPNIKNATGTLDLSYAGTLIQIPFVMRDKEILPFDTLQVGTENTIYTRENLRNILFNLKNMSEKQRLGGVKADPNISSFTGVEKAVGKMTDTGFMSDMVQIQNLIGSHATAVTAYAAKVEDLLEKTAQISKVNLNYRALRDDLVKEFNVITEKIASAEYDEPEDKILEKQAVFDNLEKRINANVQILRNKDKFMFTEKDGMIVSRVPAVIYKSLMGIKGVSVDDDIVIAADGRFKVLRPGDKFMFDYVPGDDDVTPFELKRRQFESLNPGGVYTAEIGGTCLVPFTVTKAVSGAKWALNVRMFYYCIDVNGFEFVMIPASVDDNQMALRSKKEILSQAMQNEDPRKLSYYNVLLRDQMPILCVSSNTEFIKLEPGSIMNMESPKEAMLLYEGNVKLASLRDEVKITLISREGDPKYNVSISWFDKRMQRNRKMEISNVNEPKLKGILKTVGFGYNEVSEIAYKAKREGTAVKELGPNHTPWFVKPEVASNMAADNTIKTMRDSFFTVENARKAAAALIGSALGGIAVGTALGEPAAGLGAIASESEALAEKLEKVAIAKQSPSFNKIAGLMVIKNRVDNLVKEALNGEEFEGTEVLAELHEVCPYLEKVAYDLVDLKLRQAMLKDEILSPNVINATLRHIDGLHKYAKHFSIGKTG